MQNHFGAVRSEERYSVDADLLREIKQVRCEARGCVSCMALFTSAVWSIKCNSSLILQHLKQQQEGISHLISVIKDDLEDIKLIEHGLSDGGHMRGGILSWAHVTIRTLTLSPPKDILVEYLPAKQSSVWSWWTWLTFNLCHSLDCKYTFIFPFYAAVDTLLINFTETEKAMQHRFTSVVVHKSVFASTQTFSHVSSVKGLSW